MGNERLPFLSDLYLIYCHSVVRRVVAVISILNNMDWMVELFLVIRKKLKTSLQPLHLIAYSVSLYNLYVSVYYHSRIKLRM